MIPIVENYLSFIKPGMRVLEIGCGSWDLVRNYTRDIGAHYEGIDTQAEYFGRKTIATRIENLACLSFPNDHFDVVIGSQTMEHWAEHGCSLRWGLHQCFRVCKPNGLVLMNVPIHYHGTHQFMLGRLPLLDSLFAIFSNTVSFERWGRPARPLPPLYTYPGYWGLRHKPAYVLDIKATKDRPLPRGSHNRLAPSGRLAQVLNYPFSYNVYRVACKTGLQRGPDF